MDKLSKLFADIKGHGAPANREDAQRGSAQRTGSEDNAGITPTLREVKNTSSLQARRKSE